MKVAIIGTGLMGGSLALRLRSEGIASEIIGVDSNPEHLQAALALQLIDCSMNLPAAIAASDVIIVAIPVDATIAILPIILNQVNDQIILDLGSTKTTILESIQIHPRRGRFVGTHPMWGTEKSGPSSAVSDAFKNRAVVLCDHEQSDSDAFHWVRDMYKKIGMRILYMNSAEHDLHVAYISHVSHITSFALANTVLEKEKEEAAIFELASGGFESTVRLAKSNPLMWGPIFINNRENVLDVLDEHILQLQKFKNAITTLDDAALMGLMNKANHIKRIIP